mmetsp:Transcript_8848/g.23713  ORF Transcript_8848/g.23713 Transcript_8848/m.23713 type:complete len:205 (+) Transcript_8848:192-806(+)
MVLSSSDGPWDGPAGSHCQYMQRITVEPSIAGDDRTMLGDTPVKPSAFSGGGHSCASSRHSQPSGFPEICVTREHDIAPILEARKSHVGLEANLMSCRFPRSRRFTRKVARARASGADLAVTSASRAASRAAAARKLPKTRSATDQSLTVAPEPPPRGGARALEACGRDRNVADGRVRWALHCIGGTVAPLTGGRRDELTSLQA